MTKLPRIPAIFALVRRAQRELCSSCATRRPHWAGHLNGKFAHVCLRCGQVNHRVERESHWTIRVAVRTPKEARIVKRLTHKRDGLWVGNEIMLPDGSLHVQYGSYDKAIADDITAQLRAAGFRATWEERDDL